MKILWCTVDRSWRTSNHFDWFQKAVCKIADVDFIRLPIQEQRPKKLEKTIPLFLKQKQYDFLFSDALFPYMHEDWGSFDIPTGAIIEDQHGEYVKKWMDFAINNIDAIFTRYKNPLQIHHAKSIESMQVFWLPHCIDVDDFKNINYKKSIDVLHTGSASNYYPFRQFIIKELNNKPYFKRVYRSLDTEPRRSHPSGKDYFKLLASAKIHPTGGSYLEYVVGKYFHIPAAGVLLMSPSFQELKDLGFKDGENMIIVNENNLVFNIEFYLKNDKEREKITECGKQLVFDRHTSDIRAEQFIEMIEEIL